MEKITELKLAEKWFADNGIIAYIVNNDDLYIKVGDFEIMVSSSEVSYRAELQIVSDDLKKEVF